METTLFDKQGKPVAYIAGDGETIYLWDGRPVAYLFEDKVYGFNGKQLGWFSNGTIFDIYGLRAGFIRSKSPIITGFEPAKGAKHIIGRKNVRQMPVVKPALCYGFSEKILEQMLGEGKAKHL
jgi:hypothetical protein